MSDKLREIQHFFNNLSQDNLDLVDQFYDRDIYFIDPLVSYRNRQDLKAYYQRLYRNVDSIQFEFTSNFGNEFERGVTWRMTFVAPKFNGGQPVVAEGMSHIKFGGKEDKAIYHRDYFDVGEYVYEHVPVLSGLVKFVKKKMVSQH